MKGTKTTGTRCPTVNENKDPNIIMKARSNSSSSTHKIVGSIRWTKARLLEEARKRTKELFTDNSVRVQKMLATLLKEAGWSEEEFIDALCQDVIVKGSKPARG